VQDSNKDGTEKLKAFLSEAWIEDQLSYQHQASRRDRSRHERLALSSNVLFGLTLCAAILHVVHFGPRSFELALAFLVIALPATGAGITAIRTHRDYLRKSMRAEEMAAHLRELKYQMGRVTESRAFQHLIAETEQTMLHENEDWRVVVRFHTPELPV
jgi:hypothetical protein